MSFIFNNGIIATLDYNPNDATLSNGLAFYHLKELLKLVGWTHEASNDGTNVSNTTGNANDQVGSGSEMAATNAYWFGSRPAISAGIGAPGNDIIGIRHHSASTSFSIYYTPPNTDGTKQAKTVNGTTTTIPQWATMKGLRGNFPDSPPSTTWCFAPATTRRYSFAADNTPPYGWYFFGHGVNGISSVSAGNGGTWMIFDICEPQSMHPLDIAPVVFSAADVSTSEPYWNDVGLGSINSSDAAGGPMSWWRYGLTGQVWAQTPALHLRTGNGNTPIIPGGVGLYSYDTADDPRFPLYYGAGGYTAATGRVPVASSTPGQPIGIKGRSYMLGWRSGAMPFGHLLKRFTAGDRCVFGDITIPWDGSTQVTYT